MLETKTNPFWKLNTEFVFELDTSSHTITVTGINHTGLVFNESRYYYSSKDVEDVLAEIVAGDYSPATIDGVDFKVTFMAGVLLEIYDLLDGDDKGWEDDLFPVTKQASVPAMKAMEGWLTPSPYDVRNWDDDRDEDEDNEEDDDRDEDWDDEDWDDEDWDDEDWDVLETLAPTLVGAFALPQHS